MYPVRNLSKVATHLEFVKSLEIVEAQSQILLCSCYLSFLKAPRCIHRFNCSYLTIMRKDLNFKFARRENFSDAKFLGFRFSRPVMIPMETRI